MKPYACIISAHYGGSWEQHRPLGVYATSKDAAKQIALIEARRRWPTAKGWTRHAAQVATFYTKDAST